jgi:hypothetical protein
MEGVIDQNNFIEVMYNGKYGGFSFSEEAIDAYCETLGIKKENLQQWRINRADPCMVRIVKELKEKANGRFADIRIRVIPKIYEDCYTIGEYDGCEYVNISYKKYKLDRIEEVLDSPSLSHENKENQIRSILASKDSSDSEIEEEEEDQEDQVHSPKSLDLSHISS